MKDSHLLLTIKKIKFKKKLKAEYYTVFGEKPSTTCNHVRFFPIEINLFDTVYNGDIMIDFSNSEGNRYGWNFPDDYWGKELNIFKDKRKFIHNSKLDKFIDYVFHDYLIVENYIHKTMERLTPIQRPYIEECGRDRGMFFARLHDMDSVSEEEIKQYELDLKNNFEPTFEKLLETHYLLYRLKPVLKQYREKINKKYNNELQRN